MPKLKARQEGRKMEFINTIGTWGIKAFAFAGMLLIGYMFLRKLWKQEQQLKKENKEEIPTIKAKQ